MSFLRRCLRFSFTGEEASRLGWDRVVSSCFDLRSFTLPVILTLGPRWTALTYHLISFLPTLVTDTFLALQDRLVSFILLHYRSQPAYSLPLASGSTSAPSTTGSSTTGSRPLPHPPFLRPGQGFENNSQPSTSESAASMEELSFSTESNATLRGGNSSNESSEKGDEDEFGSFVKV